jgi:hypothetical protein
VDAAYPLTMAGDEGRQSRAEHAGTDATVFLGEQLGEQRSVDGASRARDLRVEFCELRRELCRKCGGDIRTTPSPAPGLVPLLLVSMYVAACHVQTLDLTPGKAGSCASGSRSVVENTARPCEREQHTLGNRWGPRLTKPVAVARQPLEDKQRLRLEKQRVRAVVALVVVV